MTSMFLKKEDDLIMFENERRQLHFTYMENNLNTLWTISKKIMQPKTMKDKNNGCGNVLGYLFMFFIEHFLE